MEQLQKRQTAYITGLKGLACVMVMVGHYLDIYGYASDFTPSIPLLDRLLRSSWSFLVNEQYWLYLFFIVSGYLVSASSICSVFSLLKKCFLRFLRLALPVLFSCGLIYLLSLTFGFHAGDTGSFFQCEWFQSCYLTSFSWLDVVKSPIETIVFRRPNFNPPYWVLRDMFLSSCLIYFIRLMSSRWIGEASAIVTTLLAAVLYQKHPVIAACLFGSLVWLLQGNCTFHNHRHCVSASLLLLSLLLFLLPSKILSLIFFAALLILIPELPCLDSLFSSRLFQFLGRISWGIYSFHWPVCCSIGALIFIKLSLYVRLPSAYILSLLLSAIVTVLISFLFYHSFEHLSGVLLWKINSALCAVTKKKG